MTKEYWTRDRIMHLIIGTVIAAALIWLINSLSDVLLPFFVACFVAYLLEPVVGFNMRWTHCRSRILGTVLTLLEVGLVLGALLYIFVPVVIKETDMLGNLIKGVSTGKNELPAAYTAIIQFVDRHFDADAVISYLSGSHLEALLSKGSSIIEESVDVLLKIIGWLLTLIYILFILIDYPQISNGFKLIFPKRYRQAGLGIVHDVQQSMNHYFRGQGVVALCAMVFYCTGFSIVGLPLAIPMGVLVGVLYMIPYFQYVTLIPVAAICFIYSLGGEADFLTEFGQCCLVYVVSQSICDYVITPHIMGKEMGLNPAIILLSLSVWGSLMGIIGMIIALPTTALIMTYYEKYISER